MAIIKFEDKETERRMDIWAKRILEWLKSKRTEGNGTQARFIQE